MTKDGFKALLVVLAIIASVFLVTLPAYAVTEHCPAGGVKTEAQGDELNDIVPPAGTLVCVKGSTDATGIVTADGEDTLFEILGNGHDVSYFVVYTDEEEPTPTPTPSPSPSPSEEPPVDNPPKDNPPKDKPPVEPGHNTGKVGSGPLPTTGFDAGEASLIGLGLLAVAAAALWATRRRDIS